jgi:hypothetical protein
MNDLLKMDGFDEAILGEVIRFSDRFLIYDHKKVIEILMRDMSEEEAMEYWEFNQVGAWVGSTTPGFLLEAIDET